MGSGGARNRSGPPKDPASGRSDRNGVSLTALPAAGYDGEIPKWPLPKRIVVDVHFEDKKRVTEVDDNATEAVAEREVELWEWAWRTPQASAWALPSEMWRLHSIAMWVRTYVICEGSDATAADKGSLHRFADQIALTPAGLKENGWAIKADELGAKRAESAAAKSPAKGEDDEMTKRRKRAISGAGG
jgi:hypothetical protein